MADIGQDVVRRTIDASQPREKRAVRKIEVEWRAREHSGAG
jgi:hypothetical protein